MRIVFVLLCGVLVLAGCGVPGGVVVEGRASQVSPPPSTSPLPSGTPKSADAVAVLRADPELTPKVKAQLVPCSDGNYPVDDRFLDLTGDGTAELVVTLYTCAGSDFAVPGAAELKEQRIAAYGGYAAYVYDLAAEPPTRLLGIEDAAVDIIVSRKDHYELVVFRSRWAPRDDPCCPTDQSVVLYQWDGTKFIEVPE